MARAAEDGNIKLIHAGLVDWAIMADEETPEGTTEESPSGVAAKPTRRRGGRRRHGGQRDGDGDGDAEDTDTDVDADGDEEEDDSPAAEEVGPAPMVADLEETAATDFDLPSPVEPEATTAEDAEEQVPWFDPDEEPVAVTATDDGAAGEPEVAATPDPDATGDQDDVPEGVQPEEVFGEDAELVAAVQEVVASISLPSDPEDSQNPERISDLVVMADHLEHRQGARHVAFTYLVDEVCSALEQGLEAGNPQIAHRWTGVGTRDYVSKALRGLSDSGIFKRSIIAWRQDGQRRQRRIINLVRDNDLVDRVLTARLGPAANSTPPAEPPDETEALPSPVEPEDSGDTPAEAVEDQPAVEQPSLASDNGAAEPVADNGAAEPAAEDGTAEPAAEDEPPPPPADDYSADDVYDEPQPRSTRRRRPFTSRLLRS
jgi:hypothetical protein